MTLNSSQVLIGNYLVTAPNAVTWLSPEDKTAFTVDFGGEYVAGIADPDDSYHGQHLKLNGADVFLEWGRVGNYALGRITSDRDTEIGVTLTTKSWPDYQ